MAGCRVKILKMTRWPVTIMRALCNLNKCMALEVGQKKKKEKAFTTPLVLLEFFRWVWRSLVAPSWNVLGKAPRSMVNSGVFSSKREISTTWAAYTTQHTPSEAQLTV